MSLAVTKWIAVCCISGRIWARVTLVAVDLCAASGILWVRGGDGWTLLVLLPPVALAIAFFAERGGALATLLAVLVIVAVYGLWNMPASGWMPSLLVFLGVAVLIVVFLSISSAQVRETSANLRWLLSGAQATAERLQVELWEILVRLRTLEQTQEPLLHERARFTDTAEPAMLAQRAAQGDPAATEALQTIRSGAYGSMAELASAASRLSHASAASENARAISTLDASAGAEGQALESGMA